MATSPPLTLPTDLPVHSCSAVQAREAWKPPVLSPPATPRPRRHHQETHGPHRGRSGHCSKAGGFLTRPLRYTDGPRIGASGHGGSPWVMPAGGTEPGSLRGCRGSPGQLAASTTGPRGAGPCPPGKPRPGLRGPQGRAGGGRPEPAPAPAASPACTPAQGPQVLQRHSRSQHRKSQAQTAP